MSKPARDLTNRALGLPEEERLALAAELIDSVEGAADPEWEAAWLEELERRKTHGTSDAKPWSEVRARLLRRLSGS
ncbi:MAG: addiction module protein [Myxococcota bacterium]